MFLNTELDRFPLLVEELLISNLLATKGSELSSNLKSYLTVYKSRLMIIAKIKRIIAAKYEVIKPDEFIFFTTFTCFSMKESNDFLLI